MLTDEQKREIVGKFINPEKDFEKAANGMILLTAEASKRIADEYGLEIKEGGRYNPKDIIDYILRREGQKLAAAESIKRAEARKQEIKKAKVDKILACIKGAIEAGEESFAIAQRINIDCGDIETQIIFEVLDNWKENEHYIQADSIKKNYYLILNRNAAIVRFTNSHATIKNKEVLTRGLIEDVFSYYTKGVMSLGHLLYALNQAEIEPEIIEAVKAGFYTKYEPLFIEKYSKMNLTQEQLIDDVMKNYVLGDVFDTRLILTYISKMEDASYDVEDIAYQMYKKDGDEKAVFQILVKQGLSAEEYAQELLNLDLYYPVDCVRRTMNLMKIGYKGVPYEAVFDLYEKGQKTASEEESELEHHDESVAVLVGDELVESDKIPVEQHDEADAAKHFLRLKIVEKKREIKKSEKKKTLAVLLAASGIIPVIVLTWQFRVDPVIAARNIAASLSQLADGTIGIAGLLPKGEQLVGLLSGAALAFAGLMKKRKHNKRIKELKEDLAELEGPQEPQREQEVEEDLENVESLAPKSKKGRR